MNAGDKGVAVKAVDPQNASFGGGLTIMVGISTDGEVLGYSVLETHETPGLGAKAAQWFQKGGKGDIIGRNLNEEELTVSKDGGNVDAITASTITSRAFLRAVNAAWQAYSRTQPSQSDTDGVSGATTQDNN
jgi:electron transport complex protein RnfG